MADQAAATRAEAIEGFAAVLRELRAAAGQPSFRQMSGRSRAISHTTLHEAAQGHRLPSWATTVEFVKACGADPDRYRARWEQASRLVQAVQLPPAPAATPAVTPLEPVTELLPEPSVSTRRRHRPFLLATVTAVVVAAAVAVTVSLVASSHDTPVAATALDNPTLTAKDCPVHRPNPPAAPPAHAGDADAFIADMTLPDCSHVRRGETVTKVWRLKNTGTVAWLGYSLHRIDLPQQRDQCQTITDVPVHATEPGEMVDIRTEITAPDKPGFCFVRFKLVDADGRVAFPGSRPVNFQIIVD